MMRRYRHKPASAFTLVELAIVLAIVGVLAVGLFRLMSGSNTAQSNAAAANTQSQLIAAVKAYLSSTSGANYMNLNSISCGGAACPPGPGNFALPLPATAGSCTTADSNYNAFCNYLPASFSSNTTNSYGQTFAIHILRDTTPNPTGTTPPQSYSFMIMTTGGSVIPDSSGGSISAQIGGDGGFVFTSPVCGTPAANYACGAYSNWSSLTSAYGFTGVSGKVASRTFVSPLVEANQPWLARQVVNNDTSLNTMQTNMYLTTGQTINLASPSAVTPPVITNSAGTALGTLNLDGGALNLNTGTAYGDIVGTGLIDKSAGAFFNVDNAGEGLVMNYTLIGQTSPAPASALLTLNSPCTSDPTVPTANLCSKEALSIFGDVKITGKLFAGTSISMTTSDIRLKKDIRPLKTPLEDIMRLNPVSFTYKTSEEKDIGVIAQDVEKVYPELVGMHDGFKGVNYDGLIAPLIGAVQELKHQNDDLRQRVNDLQHQLDQQKTDH